MNFKMTEDLVSSLRSDLSVVEALNKEGDSKKWFAIIKSNKRRGNLYAQCIGTDDQHVSPDGKSLITTGCDFELWVSADILKEIIGKELSESGSGVAVNVISDSPGRTIYIN